MGLWNQVMGEGTRRKSPSDADYHVRAKPWCWGVQRHEACILFPGL